MLPATFYSLVLLTSGPRAMFERLYFLVTSHIKLQRVESGAAGHAICQLVRAKLQDGITTHTVWISINILNQTFPGRLKSNRGDIALPVHSPDLTLFYFMWDNLPQWDPDRILTCPFIHSFVLGL